MIGVPEGIEKKATLQNMFNKMINDSLHNTEKERRNLVYRKGSLRLDQKQSLHSSQKKGKKNSPE